MRQNLVALEWGGGKAQNDANKLETFTDYKT